jgi:hypothetical protein
MRLEQHEIASIKRCAERHFGPNCAAVSPAESAVESLHSALIDAHHAAMDVATAAGVLVADYVVTPAEYADFSTEKLFAVDASLYRYMSLISAMQDRLFKSIAVVEQEDVDRISRRDLTELVGKLGALTDAARFGESAIAGDILAHTYLSHVDDRAERLNEALRNAVFLVQAFNEALDFVVRRRPLPVQPLAGLHPVAISLAEVSH